jgi:catechol 2,3-dioxygenase-like lactoylglutathione lyase family enzyme
MLTKLGHVAIRVKDLEQSAQFYCDVLGFKRAYDMHDDSGNPWLIFIEVVKGDFIELFCGGETPVQKAKDQAGFEHFCIEVDDIQAVANHIKSKGVSLSVEPKQGRDGNYQCWVLDPNGFRIEFMQIMPNSMQSTH